MVLATDGLWDKLASADAAALIGMHAREHPIDEANFEDDDRESCDAGPGAGFALADANPCTHLLRNALGGGSHAGSVLSRLQVGVTPVPKEQPPASTSAKAPATRTARALRMREAGAPLGELIECIT